MDTKLIPKGYYCYSSLDIHGTSFKVVGKCPYWKNRRDVDGKEVHDQNYGYCLFLGKGDIELNSESKLKITYPETHPDYDKEMTADEIGLCFSTLWDMTKMCCENMDDPDAVYEQHEN